MTEGVKVKLANWRKGFKTRLRILWSGLRKFNDDHGFFLSSGITFNLLICLIPLILLLLALLGTYLYSYREVLNHIRHYMENAFPSLDPRIMNNILRIIRDGKIVGGVGMIPVIRFILKYLIPFLFTFWMCLLIYKIIPNKKIHFKTALQAALLTSLLWELSKQFFGWYVLHLGRFSILYGSLSTLAIFFLWIYYSSVILLLGGEVAFLLERKRE